MMIPVCGGDRSISSKPITRTQTTKDKQFTGRGPFHKFAKQNIRVVCNQLTVYLIIHPKGTDFLTSLDGCLSFAFFAPYSHVVPAGGNENIQFTRIDKLFNLFFQYAVFLQCIVE